MTADEVRERLRYDPETGVFVWLKSMAPYRNGRVAGGPMAGGYRGIPINGKYYLAHRLAWLYVHGEWPPEEIDHINGDGSDNRLSNLRLATRSQNMMNVRVKCNSESGLKNIRRDPRTGKYSARMTANGKRIYLGAFLTVEEAFEAYRHAAIQYCGEFARTA